MSARLNDFVLPFSSVLFCLRLLCFPVNFVFLVYYLYFVHCILTMVCMMRMIFKSFVERFGVLFVSCAASVSLLGQRLGCHPILLCVGPFSLKTLLLAWLAVFMVCDFFPCDELQMLRFSMVLLWYALLLAYLLFCWIFEHANNAIFDLHHFHMGPLLQL